MNSFQHFNETRKIAGIWMGFLSMLPDIFVLIRGICPFSRVKKFCLKMHNTQESIDMTYKINEKLGMAWLLHRIQDIKTHDFKYE